MNEPVPNLFLIGAPKCGTTALAYNLAQHPQIYLPERKEPRFFDAAVFYDNPDDAPLRTLEAYLKLYDSKDSAAARYRMDASVFNMYTKEGIDAICELSPQARFIVVLRDPVEASVSMHRQRLSYIDPALREVSEDFNACWRLLDARKEGKGYPKGCKNRFLFRYDLLYAYERYLPRLREKLGDRLFIGFYDTFKADPDRFYKELFEFLDLKYVPVENRKINESRIVRTNAFLRMMETVQARTLPLRKRLGLTGLSALKRTLLRYFETAPMRTEPDEEVYAYFKPTYAYLERLRREVRR
jgi:hypothetical protein